MEYDVIVAGAGPAGSTAGYELSRRGYSVLILEKQNFPREKLCAGGLPRKILDLLEIREHDIIEKPIDTVEFTLRGRRRFVLRSPQPLLYTVRRSRFDRFLLQRARSAGCQVIEGQAVQDCDQRQSRMVVRTAAREYVSRVLIGADGVGGAVSRRAGFSHRRRLIATLQADLPLNDPGTGRFRDRVWIGFGWISKGYTWVFPKKDRLAVGMGAFLRGRGGAVIKDAFRRFLEELFPQHQEIPVRSAPIALYRKGQALVRGRTALVGEAGNLVHPLTAEGIYYAVKSARLAADTIDDFLSGRAADLLSYQRRIDRGMGAFFHKSWIFSGLFYGLPRVSFRLFVNDNRFLRRYFGEENEVNGATFAAVNRQQDQEESDD
jgi:geranylgeranyl reductase family protein